MKINNKEQENWRTFLNTLRRILVRYLERDQREKQMTTMTIDVDLEVITQTKIPLMESRLQISDTESNKDEQIGNITQTSVKRECKRLKLLLWCNYFWKM
ncbi:hypothetical protein EVAR_23540_1 [Eumeta japonica]|uniref:Uncharacterized protein n=1 Tax=Eumeta variegata TaxID=151549 RepID=A0A4C1WYJ1_EUMVA|nr:hypothetical protein EVAR_23540_1 [Eumeta japonica]